MAFAPQGEGEKITEQPAWFKEAIGVRPELGKVDVQDATVHYLKWSSPDKPGLLLVHGHSASAHWWRFIAPLLAKEYNIAALHLTGMGDSEWREAYRADVYAEELLTVCEHAELGDKPVIAAHSFGGGIALQAGATYQDSFGGIIILDSGVRPHNPNPPRFEAAREGGDGHGSKPEVVFESKELAFERFRLTPPQPCSNQYILDFIAELSIEDVEGGWSWKTDPDLGLKGKAPSALENVRNITCRLGVIYGQMSNMFTSDVIDYMRVVMGDVPIVGIPEARHHLMIDQPLAFVSALRTMLADWETSEPHAREPVSDEAEKEAADRQLAAQNKREREAARYR